MAVGFWRRSISQMADTSEKSGIPAGFTLEQVLLRHGHVVNRFAWSPSGQMLATPSDDKRIGIWDAKTGRLLRTLTGHRERVYSVA